MGLTFTPVCDLNYSLDFLDLWLRVLAKSARSSVACLLRSSLLFRRSLHVMSCKQLGTTPKSSTSLPTSRPTRTERRSATLIPTLFLGNRLNGESGAVLRYSRRSV